MLSEARARLANTQGKKAKRKARERQLEEARRLAALQKRRELKAAGVLSGNMRNNSKKKGMDVRGSYNADIPFEKKAAPGFYDTSEEQARITSAPVDPEAEEAESIGRRRKLVLPAAQVGESELEDIVKIGQAGESAKALVNGGSEASGRLLTEYEGLENARMARTPRTARSVNPSARRGEYSSAYRSWRWHRIRKRYPPSSSCIHPEPSSYPRDTEQSGDVAATPRTVRAGISTTPLRTPMRDNLSINPADQTSFVGDTPREQKLRESSAKRALKAGFLNLPKPENNFELLVPDDEGGDGDVDGQTRCQRRTLLNGMHGCRG
ncbi:MYB transcription factor [Salix suchowensis]|nr:MYB transcription factor [Salix suchowensis]